MADFQLRAGMTRSATAGDRRKRRPAATRSGRSHNPALNPRSRECADIAGMGGGLADTGQAAQRTAPRDQPQCPRRRAEISTLRGIAA
jgi:hypothetical protein